MKAIYSELVSFLGGQVATAKKLGVSQSNISGYINGRWNMSEIVALRAEKATNGKFKAVDLCPSLQNLIESLTA